VNSSLYRLKRFGKVKVVGKGPSRHTGATGSLYVASQYFDAAKRAAA